MRKSIFDIASESVNMMNEAQRLVAMAEKENTVACLNLLILIVFVIGNGEVILLILKIF